jgi:hypothetical protein
MDTPWSADRNTLRPVVEANVLGSVERSKNDADMVDGGVQAEPITWFRLQPNTVPHDRFVSPCDAL